MSEKEDKIKTSLLADDLASLENYIHDLFNFSPLPICFVSPIGVFLEVNPAFEVVSKLKSYELIGEPIEKLFKKEEIEKLTKKTLEQEIVKGIEMKFFPKQQESITVQVFTRVRKDEKVSCQYCRNLFRFSVWARNVQVEKYARTGENIVALAIVDGYPMTVNLGHAIGAARIERRFLRLWNLDDFPEHLAA